MFDAFGPAEPWIGLLDAFGVLLVFLVWSGLRNAGDRARAVASALGAVFLAITIVGAFTGVAAYVMLISSAGFDVDGGSRVLDILLIVLGVVVGVLAVLAAARRAAEAEEDLAADALVDDETDETDTSGADVVGDETDDEVVDAYLRSRERLVAFAPWTAVAALALALALPVDSARGFMGEVGFTFDRDVSVIDALHHIVVGVLLAVPLLVVSARDDLADLRGAAAAFALVAAGALVQPLWPGIFANEFWTAFGVGLAAGLVATVALSLFARAVPADHAAAVTGAVAALALLAGAGVLTGRVIDENNDSFGPGVFEDDTFTPVPGGPTPVFPTDFPVSP